MSNSIQVNQLLNLKDKFKSAGLCNYRYSPKGKKSWELPAHCFMYTVDFEEFREENPEDVFLTCELRIEFKQAFDSDIMCTFKSNKKEHSGIKSSFSVSPVLGDSHFSCTGNKETVFAIAEFWKVFNTENFWEQPLNPDLVNQFCQTL